MARRAEVGFCVLLLCSGVLPAAAAAQEPSSCFGRRPTIVGTDGPDELNGTSAPDVIVGLGGRDEIEGLGGADRICAGPGPARYGEDLMIAEEVDGGPGNDLINGGHGPNVLIGGDGHDLIRGHVESDAIVAGRGRDVVIARARGDSVDGGPGRDTVRLGRGRDFGHGGGGDDILSGGPGGDFLGSDRGYTCGGEVVMDCDPGRPAEAGTDTIRGDAGNDLFAVGIGDDFLDGGEGTDHAVFSSFDADSVFVADLQEGSATSHETGVDVVVATERLSAFSRGDVTLIGDGGNNHLGGGAAASDGGSVTFIGGGGDDDFHLVPPVDRGETGPSSIDGGDGDDYVHIAACSPDPTPYGPVSHSLDMGGGNDHVEGSCVDDLIAGGDGDDALRGNGGIDTIDGGPGDDTCEGELVSNCEIQ